MSRRPHSTRIWIVLALLLLSLGSAGEALAAPGDPLAFFTVVPPCRVFDSREPAPQFIGDGPALAGHVSRFIPITGSNGNCNIPAGAEVVTLNVTVTQPTTGGKLFIGPGGASLPSEAMEKINFTPGATKANNVTVDLASGGIEAEAEMGGTVHVIVDITGYYAPGSKPPVLTAGGTLNYTEGDPAAGIDTTITVSDPDSANLQSATVQITGNYQNGADVLSFANTATITGVFNAATGTLTLTGSDTLANWQTALRSVLYNNTSEDPSTAARTVTWVANDGIATSAPVTSTINVTAVPDAPVLTAGGTLNYTEGDPPTAIDTTITVSDVDSANLQSATAQITGNYQNGEDVLSFVNTATITGMFNAATGTLTLTGSDTLANWQTALRNVLYNNTSEDPSNLARTVTWIASDGTNSSAPVTSTINIGGSPDAPVLTAGGTLNYTEGDPATAIDTTITVTDPDNANLQSATVQITGNYQNGADVLSFVNTATITGVFNAATGTLTLTGSDTLANWQTALRSVLYNNTSEDPSTLARTVTWIASDGANSSTPVTSTINVTAVPDAPVLTAGGSLNYTEGDPPTAIDTTITVNDVDSANLQSATAQITGNYQNGADVLSFVDTATITGMFNPATGTLTLTGSDTLANWQTALRSVRYNNTSEDPSTAARTVTWIASDGSASSSPVTSTINVATVADAPVLTAGGTLSYTEGNPATAIDTTITVNDADSANLQSATVQITGNYQSGADVLSFANTATITGIFNAATGTLTLTGSDTLANWQTALRSVLYSNTSDNPSTLTRTVTWIASDGGASSSPVTSTINVSATNDAPVLTAGGVLSYTEGDPATAIDTTITVNDADSANLQSATAQITGNYQNGEDILSFVNTATITGVFNAATGTLTLTGSDTLANWQTALRSVRYNNTSNNPTTSPRTVTWIASDGSASSLPVTSTINVASVPDAPILTAGGVLNYTENGPAVAIDTTITVTDEDSANLQSATVQITGNYQNGQDVLSFVNTATITGVFSAATGTLTLTGSDTLANWQTALRSVRYNNTSENPSTAARTVTWIASDGGASSSPVTSTINVTAVPDAPSVTAGGTLSYTENDPATAIDTTITVIDVDSANLQSATVQITNNYANGQDILSFSNTATITGVFNAAAGTLTLTGTDTVANWQTALRNVRYSNSSDNPSSATRTVTWIVSDGSASSTPVTSTINVIPVNDGPQLIASPRETFHTIGNTAFEFKTVQSMTPGVWVSGKLADNFLPDPDGPSAFTFNVVPASVTAGAEVTVNSADGSFSYVPAPGATGSDTFQVIVSDGAPPSVTRTVTINLVERVWYVRNNEPAGGDGQSNHPFDTLAEAQTASGPNDFIFVYRGDGTNLNHTAGIVLKNGQRLLGEHTGLSVPTPVGFNGAAAAGSLTLVTGVGGNHPLIGDAAGSGVSMTDAVPLDISGVNVASSANAINWTTTAAFAGTNTGLTVRDVIVRSAGGKGVNILLQGTGALRLAFHDDNLTSTGTALDVQETGAGSLTITAFDDNAVSASTGGTGINVNNAIFDAVPGGGVDPVAGGATVIGASGDGVGGSGMVLTGVQGAVTFTDLDIFASNGAGLRVSGTGSMSFTVPAGVSIIEATGGPAVDAASTALILPLQTLKSTNSPTTGVSLVNVSDGTQPAVFSASSGSSITTTVGATGPAFNVSGGNASITYGGTITNNGTSSRAVSISTWTGDDAGDDILFSGAIDENGAGILVSGNAGAGRSITFSGGMDIDTTGSNEGFAATSNTNTGGLHITGTNTIDSVSGTALRVTNTQIGNSGLTFRSISAGTGSGSSGVGIVLDTTGTSASNGGLTVAGNGGAGTGGTIQHKTGADDSTTGGIGIYLNNTKNASFNRMQLNDFDNFAIRGSSVQGFTLNNSVINGVSGNNGGSDEAVIRFDNLLVSGLIDNSTIQGGVETNIRVINNTGTLNALVIQNSTIRSNSTTTGGDGIFARAQSGATMTVKVLNCTMHSHRDDHIQTDAENTGVMNTVITGNTLTSNGTIGAPPQASTLGGQITVTGGAAFASTSTFNISNNTITGAVPAPITINVTSTTSTASGLLSGTIHNNQLGQAGSANSGSSTSDGLSVIVNGASTINATITNNQIRQFNNIGMQFIKRDGSGNMNLTVTGNTVTEPVSPNAIQGILVTSGATSGPPADSGTVCADIGGAGGLANTVTGPNFGGDLIRVRQRFSTFVRLPGYGGGATDTTAVANYLIGRNTITNEALNAKASATTQAPGSFITPGGAACTAGAAPL